MLTYVIVGITAVILIRNLQMKKSRTAVNQEVAPLPDGNRKPVELPKWLAGHTGHIFLVLLVSTGLATFYFGIYTPSWESPSLAEVVEWKSTYWLPILVGLAIVYALAGYATAVTEVARAIVLAVAFMLFIGFPVWVWTTGPSTTQKSVACSPFSPDETKTCVLSGDWSSPITVDRPTKAGEFEFCVTTPVGKTYESRKVGDNVFELRSTSNEKFPIRYRLLAGTCPDKI